MLHIGRWISIEGKHDHKLSIASDFSMKSPNLIEFIRPLLHCYSPPVDLPAEQGIFLLSGQISGLCPLMYSGHGQSTFL